ncbi:hypothetical protein KVT40_005927 [Elsinoe batatas]|uniref:Uncharacterized protein n=1 Tax=Elsinoe batatas TaxID=2601811 RepID=A0A8K0L0Q7_9PEZI|nr:hypothetical protein KVT40_005927 [Elsinoe batatas]
MAATTLHMFPQAVDQQNRPLRVQTANGKQPEQAQNSSSLMAAASCGLTGISFEVNDYSDISPIVINPAANHIKYSVAPTVAPQPMPAEIINKPTSPVADNSPMTPVSRHDLPPSPVSPHFSTPNRIPSHRMQRSSDSLRRHEAMRATPLSQRSNVSNSPTLVRRNSDATERVDTPQQTYPMKSMFPQLQPGVPLGQQAYRPVDVPDSGIPRQQISKGTERSSSMPLPQPRPLLRPLAIQVPKVQSEPVLPPIASRNESLDLWNLANGDSTTSALKSVHFNIRCRTLQNGQKGITRPGLELDVVDAAGTKVYMTKLAQSTAMHGSVESFNGDLNVQRCHPEEEGTFPVAQMDSKLPIEGFVTGEHDNGMSRVTSIFPQVAALNAIKSVADSLQARTIARFDPNATSPQAAQLAFDAVQSAKEAEEATLVYRMPGNASSSSGGFYELQHPTVGPLSISVQGRNNLFDLGSKAYRVQQPAQRGSITIRGPASRPGYTVDLATLNLDKEGLVINVDAFNTLGSSFMIDAVVCALVTVAMTESFRPENGGYHTYFAAPPSTPRGAAIKPQRCASIRSTTSSCRSTKRRGLFRRPSKDANINMTVTQEKDTDSVKLPTLAKGVLKLLGFSFEAIVWVLSLGVKVLVKLISCMAGGTSKA